MNAYQTQIMVSDHIRESRQQVAAARRGEQARTTQRQPGTHAHRGMGWLLRHA
jgi:hypothetical protein